MNCLGDSHQGDSETMTTFMIVLTVKITSPNRSSIRGCLCYYPAPVTVKLSPVQSMFLINSQFRS